MIVGTIFNPAEVNTVLCMLIDVFFMIVGCDAENFMRFMTDVSGWIVIWGSSQELHIFTVFLCKIEQPDKYNKWMTHSEMLMCMWK